MTELDDQLRTFLEGKALERREGFTIANVMARFHQFEIHARTQDARLDGHDARLDAHDARLGGHDERLDKHGAAIVVIKRRLRTGSDDDDMDTGQFNVADVRRELEAFKTSRAESDRAKAEEQVWWKRTIIMWIAGILGVLVTSLLTVLITLAIAGATRTEPARPIPAAHP